MTKNSEIIDAVIEASTDVDGRKKLSCAEAFRLAEQFGVEKLEIGRICNAQKIKISNCQLGCFK